ncbi:MAG: hypothetical protein ABL998_04565 [Planctomycetota bacterium]
MHPAGTSVLFRADTERLGSYGLYQTPIGGGAPGAIVEPGLGKSVREYRLQGAWVSFLADLGLAGQVELYSHRVGVPGRIRLSRTPRAHDVTDLEPSPDGERILFRSGSEAAGFQLHIVPSDGSALPLQLTSGLAVSDFAFDPSGQRIVYRRGAELLSVSSNGGASVLLSSTAGRFEISADGTWVVYDEQVELLRVPIDGSAAPERILPPVQSGISTWRLTADGARAVFLADADVLGRLDLLSAPVAGGPSTLLASPTHPDFLEFELTPDSQQVVYLVQTPGPGFLEHTTEGVYVRALDGSQPARLLHAPNHFGAGQLAPTPDSRSVLYCTGLRVGLESEIRLWTVRLDGLTPARRIDDTGGGLPELFTARRFYLTADSSRVLFAWSAGGAPPALFSAPLDGSGPSIRLSEGSSQHFATDGSGLRAVFIAAPDSDGVFELFASLAAIGTPPVRLSGLLAPGPGAEVESGTVPALQSDPLGQELVYSLSDGTLGHVPLDGSLPAEILAASEVQGWWGISPDRTHVAFVNGSGELRSVPLSGSGPQVLLGDHPSSPAFSPDGQWLVYFAGGDVHSARVADGTHVTLSAAVPSIPLRITADSSRVVFGLQPFGQSGVQLWSRVLDGSAPAVRLDVKNLRTLHLTPDGSRALYEREQIVGSSVVSRPWSVPVDGSGPPVPLAAVPNGYISLQSDSSRCLTSDGNWLAFGANYAATSAGSGVYSCRTDGSTGAIPLAEAGRDEVRLVLVAGNERAVFLDRRGGERLFVTRLDGSSAPIDLCGPALVGFETGSEVASADGHSLVFLARPPGNPRWSLHAAPLDGSAFARRLDSGLDPLTSVGTYRILPDSLSVAYDQGTLDSNTGLRGPSDLFQVPIDRSAAPRRLGRGLDAWMLGAVASDSRAVAFVGQDWMGQSEVYRAILWDVPFGKLVRRTR